MDGLVLHPSWITSCPRPSISLSPCPHLSVGLMVELPALKVLQQLHALWKELCKSEALDRSSRVTASLGEHQRRDSVTICYKSDGSQVGLGLLEPWGTRAQG